MYVRVSRFSVVFTYIGNQHPSYIAGLSNTLRAGNVSLHFFVHAVRGVTRYNDLLLADPNDNAGVRLNTLYFEYWTPENPINTRWANRANANVYQVGVHEDASFVRLKDVTLSYELPSTLVGRLGAGGLRLYGTGRNLWTHTSAVLDPELDAQRVVPLERLFALGVNARF